MRDTTTRKKDEISDKNIFTLPSFSMGLRGKEQ